MSTTFSFVCDKCQVRCWAGQGERLYFQSYIPEFLHNHIGHNLRFLNDHVEDESDSYPDCEEELNAKTNP